MVYSTKRFVLCLTLVHFVLVFFSPFSIAITWLGEGRELILVHFVCLFDLCLFRFVFPLPPGVWEGLRFVIVALPELFSYPFLHLFSYVCSKHDCGYSLEQPHRGGSTKYQQSRFWADICKQPEFFIWKFFFLFLVVKISIYLNRRVFVIKVSDDNEVTVCLQVGLIFAMQQPKVSGYVFPLIYQSSASSLKSKGNECLSRPQMWIKLPWSATVLK